MLGPGSPDKKPGTIAMVYHRIQARRQAIVKGVSLLDEFLLDLIKELLPRYVDVLKECLDDLLTQPLQAIEA